MNITKALFHPFECLRDMVQTQYYNHIHILDDGRNQPRWRGVKVIKYPTDMILYAQVLFDKKPDFIIETGTYHGGSTLFFADIMSLYGGKQVFSIDIRQIQAQQWIDSAFPEHSHITCIKSNSVNPQLIKALKGQTKGSVMVVLDSSHDSLHVSHELDLYAPLVSPGQYLVVEDCYVGRSPYGPHYAVEGFLKTNKSFTRETLEDQFIFAVTRGGWLLKE